MTKLINLQVNWITTVSTFYYYTFDFIGVVDKLSDAPTVRTALRKPNDVIMGDIKMTPEQAALFKRGGWKELVNSEAWYYPGYDNKWSRTIPYKINGLGN